MRKFLCYKENEINEWLNSDMHDHGYQMLNDNEIADEIQDEKETEKSENGTSPSHHNEAFECLETTIKWLEQKES